MYISNDEVVLVLGKLGFSQHGQSWHRKLPDGRTECVKPSVHVMWWVPAGKKPASSSRSNEPGFASGPQDILLTVLLGYGDSRLLH